MPEVTIDPKHAILKAFLAGKGVVNAGKKTTLELSERELVALTRKAKGFGVDACIEVKGDKKPAAKADK